MANRIITISRQFGSGGRTIGRNVAEKLGIKYIHISISHESKLALAFAVAV